MKTKSELMQKKVHILMILPLVLAIGLAVVRLTDAWAEVTLPAGFKFRVVLSGEPFAQISGIAAGADGKLYVGDLGPIVHGGNQKIVVVEPTSGAASILLEGLPLGAPGRMAMGDGRPLVGEDLVVADWNTNEFAPCCNGRVFRINRESGAATVLSVGSPGATVGDPFGVALGPGGDFGAGLYVMDFQGFSPDPPFLFRIESDGTRSVFLVKPDVWTVNTFPGTIAFGSGDFGGNLYAADEGVAHPPFNVPTTPTIWRVTPQAELSAFVAGPPLTRPVSLRFGPGGPFGTDLYVLNDEGTGSASVLRVTAGGSVMTFATGLPAGQGVPDLVFAADGSRLYVAAVDSVVEIAPDVLPVTIDIKPGSFPNSINPTSKGVIPVAILTTDSFDAATVNPTTVLFGVTGTEAAPVHAALEDVNADGKTDMILDFNTQATAIQCGDTSASLTGQTLSGQAIEGSDSVNTVGCK